MFRKKYFISGLKNLGAVVFGLLVAFLMLELVLALNLIPGYYSNHKFCRGEKVRGHFHEVYGWTERPGSKYLEKKSPERPYVLHTYNSRGFRDTYDSGDERKVMVLGDSFTRGSLADDNSTYPSLLERWTPNTSFKNYGMGGYGTVQEYLVYKNVSRYHNHSLVILGYFLGNDAIDNTAESRKRPKMEAVNNSLEVIEKPKRLSIRGILTHPVFVKIQSLLKTYTHGFGFLKKQAINLLRNPQSDPAPRGEGVERKVRLTERVLEEIGNTARDQGAELLIVTIPERTEINPDNPHRFNYSDGKPFWEAQRRSIEGLADENPHISHLSLLSTLKSEFNKGNQVYGQINAHLSPSGYSVMAEKIYKRLKSEKYIEGREKINFSQYPLPQITQCQ